MALIHGYPQPKMVAPLPSFRTVTYCEGFAAFPDYYAAIWSPRTVVRDPNPDYMVANRVIAQISAVLDINKVLGIY